MDLTLAAIIIMGGWVVAIVAAGLVMILRPGGVAVPFAVAPVALPEPTGRRDEILLGGVAEVFGNFRGLVLAGRGTPSRRLLPIDRVLAAGPDRITTSLKAAEWTKLQPYATDWEIRQSVLQRLSTDPTLQALTRALSIDVQDQRVRMRGYAADDAQAQRVAQAIRSVPEVAELDLELVTDQRLARAVSEALGRDPATSAARLQVSAHFGTVDISGEVTDRAVARRIETLVSQVPEVQV